MKRTLAILAVLTLLAALLAGCASPAPADEAPSQSVVPSSAVPETPAPTATSQPASEAPAASESPAETAPEPSPSEEAASDTIDLVAHKALVKSLTADFPISDGGGQIGMWLPFETSMLTYIEGGDLNNHSVFKAIEELTGVDVQITMVDNATATEKFNIMVASGEYPDIIPGSYYSTGLDAAIADGVIINLADLIDSYCPNYKKILDSSGLIRTECTTAGGNYGSFYRIKDGVTNPTNEGAFMRMDWLEALGMDVPATYDELHDVLLAFKTEYDCEEPLLLKSSILPSGGLLTGGYGFTATVAANNPGGASATTGFYQVDGKVIYGAATEEFKEFTKLLRDWYSEGLISENCLTRQTNPFAEAMTGPIINGETGLFYNNQPFGDVYNGMSEDPDINFFPVRDVVKEEGDTNHFFEDITMLAMNSFSVTTSCQDQELVAKWIDSLYSYQCYLIINYGVEGQSWEFDENGEPQYLPDALAKFPNTNLAMSSLTSQDLPSVYAESHLAFSFGPGAKASYEVWATDKDNAYALGTNVTLTTEESEQASAISVDTMTFISENYWKFITGEKDIDAEWDSYLATLDQMGLPDLTKIVQGAYDRANS